ncbi:hypothetical protein FB446DRAFT_822329 [Lentinula raphanica]|nr:hypothetical protein FB446DRAFT_822329 [Lentinula raphanica]
MDFDYDSDESECLTNLWNSDEEESEYQVPLDQPSISNETDQNPQEHKPVADSQVAFEEGSAQQPITIDHSEAEEITPLTLPVNLKIAVQTILKNTHLKVTIGNIDIKHHHIQKLSPGRWLGDSVIDAYLLLVTDSLVNNTIILPSLIYQYIQQMNSSPHSVDNAYKATQNFAPNLFDVQWVLMPINISNQHWVAVAINMLDHTLIIYDSAQKLFSKHYKTILKQAQHERYNADKIRQMAKQVPHPPLDTCLFDDLPISHHFQHNTQQESSYLDIPKEVDDQEPHAPQNSLTDNLEPPQNNEDITMENDSEGQQFSDVLMDNVKEIPSEEEYNEGSDEEANWWDEMDNSDNEDGDPQRTITGENPLPSMDAHVYLAQFNISVEPTYNLCICISCAKPVPYSYMWSHQYQAHYRKKHLSASAHLPSRSELNAKLCELHGDQPLPLPNILNTPLEGVELSTKIKCTLSGCNGRILGGIKQLEKHRREQHPNILPSQQTSVHVQCFPYSSIKNQKTFIEVSSTNNSSIPSSTISPFIEQVINNYDLSSHPQVFDASIDTRHESSTLYHSDWGNILQGINLKELQQMTLSSFYPSLDRLSLICSQYYSNIAKQEISRLHALTRRHINSPDHDLQSKLFSRPQSDKTLARYSNTMSRFLLFLISSQKLPLHNYPIHCHPDLANALHTLSLQVQDPQLSDQSVAETLHLSIWTLLSKPSEQFLQDDKFCLFTRFLIALCIKPSGQFLEPYDITPHISEIQWCFRATACFQLLQIQKNYNNYQLSAYEQQIKPFLTDGPHTLFTTLRQHQSFYSTLAFNQIRLPAFSFNMDHSVLTVNGFPLSISAFVQSIHHTLDDLVPKIHQLFRGLPFDGILAHIDEALDPTREIPQWFIDHPTERCTQYSFLEEPRNGFKELRPLLFNHLITSSEFVNPQGLPKTGAILVWFSELDQIVSDLWVLLHSTWGGSPRGTEISGILYANYPTIPRNFFILNGLPSMFTRYSKTLHNHGHGKGIVRTPAYGVSRLLILVLALPFWAASQLGCCIGMSKVDCQRYLYEIFVFGGTAVESGRLSTILGNWTYSHLKIKLKLAQFRQFNSTLMIHATSTTLDDPEDIDPLVAQAHEQFGHSVTSGQKGYGLHKETSVTKLSADAVARMQRVSRAWHAFIKLIHPLLKYEEKAATVPENSSLTLYDLQSEMRRGIQQMETQFELKMEHINESLVRKIESGYIQIRDHLTSHNNTPSFANPRRIPVHPSTRIALARALGRGESPEFTSQEQAELINSVGSLLHVFGIIETGGGKSMAFFAAPFLLPNALFIVVSPLRALTDDLQRRFRQTAITGGVWPSPDVHWDTAQLVLVSVHHAAGQDFLNLLQSPPVRGRLSRIFFDEAHKIPTDIVYRPLFGVIHHLTRTGTPITFLSGSMMPRIMPHILRIMEIDDTTLVDEIRRDTGRPNLKYILQRTNKDTHDSELKTLVFHQCTLLRSQERGMIFTESRAQADQLGRDLGISVYHAQLTDEAKVAAALRWRNGALPPDRFMAATEAFGAGINEPHVRVIIHSNPRSLTNFLQETGRGGRDGLPASCYTLFYRIPPALPLDTIENTGDPHAQMEMREMLQTNDCIRLAFRCMDRRSHSCSSLPGAQLCSNCERLATVPYSTAIANYPQPNKTLAPDPTQPAQLIPATVKIQGMKLDSAYDASHQQIRELCDILSQVVNNGCIDCWLAKTYHTPSMDHRPEHHQLYDHASRHSETTFDSVQMLVGSHSVLLTLDHESKLYLCPQGCRVQGTLGAIWAHYINVHSHTSSKRARSKYDQGAGGPKKIPRTAAFLPSASSTSSPATASSRLPIASSVSIPAQTTSSAAPLSTSVSPTSSAICSSPTVIASEKSSSPTAGASAPSSPLIGAPPFSFGPTVGTSASSSSPLTGTPALSKPLINAPVSSSSPAVEPSASPSSPIVGSSALSSPPIGAPASSSGPSLLLSEPSSSSTPIPPTNSSFSPKKLKISVDKIFQFPHYSNVSEIFEFILSTFTQLQTSCPYHQIMEGTHSEDHELMRACTNSAISQGSEYQSLFTTSLRFTPYTHCWKCCTPVHSVFKHLPKECTYERGNLQDWWRGIPYLVFRTTALRNIIFSTLGIPPDVFPTLRAYTAWLILCPIPPRDPRNSNRFTNLSVVVFTYLYLLTHQQLPMPETGYILDDCVFATLDSE